MTFKRHGKKTRTATGACVVLLLTAKDGWELVALVSEILRWIF